MDSPEPKCAYGHVVEERIQTMESVLERVDSNVTDLHESLHQNGFVDTLNELESWRDAVKQQKEREEKRKHNFWRDAKIALLSILGTAIMSGLIAYFIA